MSKTQPADPIAAALDTVQDTRGHYDVESVVKREHAAIVIAAELRRMRDEPVYARLIKANADLDKVAQDIEWQMEFASLLNSYGGARVYLAGHVEHGSREDVADAKKQVSAAVEVIEHHLHKLYAQIVSRCAECGTAQTSCARVREGGP